MPRLVFTLALLTFLLVTAFSQITPPTSTEPTSVPATLKVRLIHSNNRPVELPVLVRLVNVSGALQNQGYTNERGEIDFRVSAPGTYRLTITSPEIHDISTENITLQPRETQRYEVFQVRPRQGAEQMRSPEPLVAAGSLAVPSGAIKEFGRGSKAMEQNDWPGARKHFERAVHLHPQYASAYNNLGVAFLNLGNRAEGRKALEKAITLDPHLQSAHVNLAKISLAESKFAEAEEGLARALAADPSNLEATTLNAYAQLALGKFEAVIASARKVHALPHQNFAGVHFLAARAFEARGATVEAIREYRAFLQEAPTAANAAAARAALAALQQKVTTVE